MSWQSVVVTGASSGIGRALVEGLAAPGRQILAIARRQDRLEALAETVRPTGVALTPAAVDVTDAEAMARALRDFDAAQPIDLLVANAGISAGLTPGRGPEAPGDALRLVQANHVGMLNTVEPVLPLMRARGRGHIALMSSMAALRPLPDMPSYSATKAAVRAYGISLRGWLAPQGISVTVLCPGFVTSPMSARHHGVRPWEIPVDRAARLMLRGLERQQPFVTFPWQLALLTWLDNRLPPRLSDRMVGMFAAEIEPEER